MATPPADQSSTTSLQDDIAALEERLWDCEYKINDEFWRRGIDDAYGGRKLRDLIDKNKRESSHCHQDLEQNIETVQDRVKVCEEAALKMAKYMSIAQDRIINLQVEAKGVRQTWPKYEKQLDELDLALKNAREEHERDMVELRVALKNAQEENEKLSNDLKDFKKTTFTKFEMVFSRLGNLANFKKRVATKFEMIFSRLGSHGKESQGSDVNEGDTRE
ncbi:hypothetical protein BHE90_014919 [Fusarium euwallaceae]|uniref:Uncharacterized protein n=2 Tax=Fusarium solani species complex TaxID=232080 RepID=A0A3M2RMI8_9HYPO|nr:hypothetical protein CDV36_013875 [Fusarium kuroshium]RTE70678.1 hypothetical protein BHE90_014919 [Fusarium euwallaceae]